MLLFDLILAKMVWVEHHQLNLQLEKSISG